MNADVTAGSSSAPKAVRVQLPGLPPTETNTVYVSFSAEINPNTTESLIALLSNLTNQNVPDVYLLLSTPGGAVMSGLNLYNVMRGECPSSSPSTTSVTSIRSETRFSSQAQSDTHALTPPSCFMESAWMFRRRCVLKRSSCVSD